MRGIREDIEILRKKAAGCEQITHQAADDNIRQLNEQRAELYRELVEEAEAALWRDHIAAFRTGSR